MLTKDDDDYSFQKKYVTVNQVFVAPICQPEMFQNEEMTLLMGDASKHTAVRSTHTKTSINNAQNSNFVTDIYQKNTAAPSYVPRTIQVPQFRSLAHIEPLPTSNIPSFSGEDYYPITDKEQSQIPSYIGCRSNYDPSATRYCGIASDSEMDGNLYADRTTPVYADEELCDPDATFRRAIPQDHQIFEDEYEMTDEYSQQAAHVLEASDHVLGQSYREPYRFPAQQSQMEVMNHMRWEFQQQAFKRYYDLEFKGNEWGCLYDRDGIICFRTGRLRHNTLSELSSCEEQLRNAVQIGGNISWCEMCLDDQKKKYQRFCHFEIMHKQELMLTHLEKNSEFSKLPILGNRFILTRLLGRGGNGEVWNVLDFGDRQHRCALKISPLYEHVQKEHRIHKSLSHENIIKVDSAVHCIEYNRKIFAAFTIETMDTDLHRLIEKHTSLDERMALDILSQSCKALSYLHCEMAIAHYDLKPSNILLSKNLQVKITDFDLARNVTAQVMTHNEGTLKYLPPEAFTAPETQPRGTAEKADIWMIGIVYHVMLSGKHPFYHDDITLEDMRHIASRYSEPTSSFLQNPSNLSPLSILILRGCLQPNPHDRPTAQQLLKIIQQHSSINRY